MNIQLLLPVAAEPAVWSRRAVAPDPTKRSTGETMSAEMVAMFGELVLMTACWLPGVLVGTTPPSQLAASFQSDEVEPFQVTLVWAKETPDRHTTIEVEAMRVRVRRFAKRYLGFILGFDVVWIWRIPRPLTDSARCHFGIVGFGFLKAWNASDSRVWDEYRISKPYYF